MRALFIRDIRLAFGSGNSLIVSLLFYLAVIVIIPFGVGPDPKILSTIGSGMLWIGALLAILLSLDRMFRSDHLDGSLDALKINADYASLAMIVFIKCLAHWVGTVLPLIIATPVLALFLNLEPAMIGIILITLLIGTPAITLIGAIGAALAVSLPRGGVLISVIVLPLAVPVMIFGVGAATQPMGSITTPLIFMTALTLIFSIVGPIASAAALKYLAE